MIKFVLVLLILWILVWVFYRDRLDNYADNHADNYADIPNLQIKQKKFRSFSDIRHVLYINLAKRTDRKAHVEEQLRRVGWTTFERIDAVPYEPGTVGCALSHIKALEYAKQQKWSHVLICEDDVRFERSSVEIQQQIDRFFSQHTDWDAILMGCTVLEGKHVDASCVRIRKAYCAHCYLVRREYYDVLIHNFREVPRRFAEKHRAPLDPEDLLDVVWHSLQNRDRWLMPFPIIATQRSSFSDIEKVDVDYTGYVVAGMTRIAQSDVHELTAIR